MNKVIALILILFSFFAFSCSSDTGEQKEEPIAIVGSDVLLPSELAKAIYPYKDAADSAKRAKEYVKSWLLERVLYREAQQLLQDTSTISAKIENYRRQLYIQEYCERYVYSNVNMKVTEKEVATYYDKHLNDYVINTSFIKAHYITISAKQAKYYDIFDKLRKSSLDDSQELSDYCAGNNRSVYFVNDWVEAQDFLKLVNYGRNIPPEELRGLSTMDFVHDTLRYLVKIDECIVPGDLLPLELAKPKIIQIIMNKRRHDKYVQACDELLRKVKLDTSEEKDE